MDAKIISFFLQIWVLDGVRNIIFLNIFINIYEWKNLGRSGIFCGDHSEERELFGEEISMGREVGSILYIIVDKLVGVKFMQEIFQLPSL